MKKKMHSKINAVEIVADIHNPEELVIPISEELFEILGWKIGDDLEWIDNKDGSCTLKKSNTST